MFGSSSHPCTSRLSVGLLFVITMSGGNCIMLTNDAIVSYPSLERENYAMRPHQNFFVANKMYLSLSAPNT